MYEKSKNMFGSVQPTHRNLLKKEVLGIGTGFAKQAHMKHSFSIKQLTLLAGIAVALILMFMLFSSSDMFTAYLPDASIPDLTMQKLATSPLKKILVLF